MNDNVMMWSTTIAIILVVLFLLSRVLRKGPPRETKDDCKGSDTLADEAWRDYHNAEYHGDVDAMDAAAELWDMASLVEVMSATTITDVVKASNRAREGSFAIDAARTLHEELSKTEVACAGNDVSKIIIAANRAPQGGEARRIATARLQALWKIEK